MARPSRTYQASVKRRGSVLWCLVPVSSPPKTRQRVVYSLVWFLPLHFLFKTTVSFVGSSRWEDPLAAPLRRGGKRNGKIGEGLRVEELDESLVVVTARDPPSPAPCLPMRPCALASSFVSTFPDLLPSTCTSNARSLFFYIKQGPSTVADRGSTSVSEPSNRCWTARPWRKASLPRWKPFRLVASKPLFVLQCDIRYIFR